MSTVLTVNNMLQRRHGQLQDYICKDTARVYLTTSNGSHRERLGEGRAAQLVHKLAQLGVCAAAEEDLALLGRCILAILIISL